MAQCTWIYENSIPTSFFLSWLLIDNQVPVEAINHIMAISNIDCDINQDFPLNMRQIQHAQAKDTILLKRIQSGRYCKLPTSPSMAIISWQSMTKFGFWNYNLVSLLGITTTYTMQEFPKWSIQLVRLLRGKVSKRWWRSMLLCVTAANATSNQTRSHMAKFHQLQLYATKTLRKSSGRLLYTVDNLLQK